MIEVMSCGYKKIVQPVLVYTGSATTMVVAWTDTGLLSGLKDIVAILVGLASLIYTITLIVDKIRKMERK